MARSRLRKSFDLAEALARIRVPTLIVQGKDDPYGTIRQVRVAEEECRCPLDIVLLECCGHAPHRDQPVATLAAVGTFLARIFPWDGKAGVGSSA